MKALGALVERVPGIALPPPQALAIRNRPRQLEADVPEPEQVPPHPARIRDLKVIVVANAAHRTLWNTLIAREHPHGMTTFAGRQHVCLDHACSALMRHCAAVRSRLACASS